MALQGWIRDRIRDSGPFVGMMLAALLVAGCQPGDGGNLVPMEGQSVEQGDTAGSVVLRNGAVSATLTARWASEASQGADIVYRNNGPAPVSVILARLKLRHERLGEAPLWAASEMTNVNREDQRMDNDDPPILYEMETSPSTTRLLLRPGEQRTLTVGFTNYPGTQRIARGDKVMATVPLGARDRTIQMVAR